MQTREECWKIFDEEAKAFGKVSSEYDLPIAVQPKERGVGGHGKIRTRSWEQLVYEVTEGEGPLFPPTGRVGLQVLLICPNKRGDVSNMIKTIEDAFNKRAYEDDRQIDFISVVRVVRSGEERTLVRILEKQI